MTGFDPHRERQPMFNLPPVTTLLVVANLLVQLARLLLPPDLDDTFVSWFALVPARLTEDQGLWRLGLLDLVTYQFIHAGAAHLIVNMLALLAFGAGIERRTGGLRLFLFFLLCGVIAAIAHIAVYPHSIEPVIGASGAISGLFGGILRLLRRSGTGLGGRLWLIILLWIATIVVTGQTGIPGEEGVAIAWVVHLGGFLAGLLLFGWFDKPRDRAADAAPR